jgi:hypothetical protein
MRKGKWSQVTVGVSVGAILCCANLTAQTNTFPSSGDVGIGTTSPLGVLDVKNASNQHVIILPNVNDTDSGVPGIISINDANSSYEPLGFFASSYYFGGGSIGIGTTVPQAMLHVHGNSLNLGSGGIMLDASDNGNPGSPDYYLGINPFVITSGEVGYQFKTVSAAGGTTIPLTLSNGNVGIGTTTPGALLEVDGNVKLTNGSGASITFPDGTVQSTAYTGTTCATGGDYAESVDVSGMKGEYEPGDVMVIGLDSDSDVAESNEPYSTRVAGIYSTKPGVVGRRQTTDPKISTTEIPMAMVGIVPTKVSAENGAISRGDLLVTASIPGYAMKGTDRMKMLGAVVGKAMGSLSSGTGVIEVLVTLQ